MSDGSIKIRECDKCKDYKRNKHGVIWANIEITEIKGGLRFTSPVDGYVSDISGITLKEFDTNAWFQGEYWYDILDVISEMGGGEWYFVDGGNTEYEYVKIEGKHYLSVEERE